jgi:hypothetical protein
VPPAGRRVGGSPDGAVDAVQGEAKPTALASGFLIVVSATRAMTLAPLRLNSFASTALTGHRERHAVLAVLQDVHCTMSGSRSE